MTDYQDVIGYSGPDLDNPYTFRENLGSAKPRKLESFKVGRLRPMAKFLWLGLLHHTRGIWLAGGALQTPGAAESANRLLEGFGATKTFECPFGHLTTYDLKGMKIQCVTRFFYSDIKSCIDTFDIRAGVWGLEYDGEDFAVYTTTDAIKDTINREIHLHSISFPVATLKRMDKYQYGGKNYTMPASTMYTYVAAVNMMDIFDEEQMALYID